MTVVKLLWKKTYLLDSFFLWIFDLIAFDLFFRKLVEATKCLTQNVPNSKFTLPRLTVGNPRLLGNKMKRSMSLSAFWEHPQVRTVYNSILNNWWFCSFFLNLHRKGDIKIKYRALNKKIAIKYDKLYIFFNYWKSEYEKHFFKTR